VNLRVPALRERRADIPFLVIHFLARVEKETGVERTLSDDSLKLLIEYNWPGNVRELENAIEGACALASGPVLHLSDMPISLQDKLIQRSAEITVGSMTAALPAEALRHSQVRNGEIVPIMEMEKQAILETIRQLNGDKILAAKLLGIGKTTLYRKLKEYELHDHSEDPSFSIV
jgi:two-component system response regulator HydG